MNSTTLDLAYTNLLRAVDEVSTAPVSSHTVQHGQWDADQQLAHLIAVDADVLALTGTIAAGGRAAFDNRRALDPHNLAYLRQRFGGLQQMRDRIQAQGRALCLLVDHLTDDELAQPVPALLVSGTATVVDQTLRLSDLLGGIANDHLPRHTTQLMNLLQPDDRPPSASGEQEVDRPAPS